MWRLGLKEILHMKHLINVNLTYIINIITIVICVLFPLIFKSRRWYFIVEKYLNLEKIDIKCGFLRYIESMKVEATALTKRHSINREKNLERKSASSLILPHQPRVP